MLTYALFDQCDIGQAIPENLYPEVSEILEHLHVLQGIGDRLNSELEGVFDVHPFAFLVNGVLAICGSFLYSMYRDCTLRPLHNLCVLCG